MSTPANRSRPGCVHDAIAYPAWRLVVHHARNGPLGLLVTTVLLLVFAGVGWWLRDRLPAPPGSADGYANAWSEFVPGT